MCISIANASPIAEADRACDLCLQRCCVTQAHYRDYNQMTYSRAVFVIHNMAHQGRGPFVETADLELPENYREVFRLYDPIGGEHMNIMKAGLQFSHRIVAVSGEAGVCVCVCV